VDEDGNRVDAEGRRLDDRGNLVDDTGEPVSSPDEGRSAIGDMGERIKSGFRRRT
jgi:hypothetical protein